MKLSFHLFRRLQWQMMSPYLLVIPLGMLLIQIVWVITALIIVELFFMPNLMLYSKQQAAVQARSFFIHNGIPDQQALTEWIHIPNSFETYQPSLYAIVDKRGQVIAAIGSSHPTLNVALQTRLSPSTSVHLQQVLTGRESDQGVAYQTSDGSVITMIPIKDRDHRIEGVLFDDSGPNLANRETTFWISFYTPTFLISMFFFAIFAFIVGGIGSLYTAHNFTRRFRNLALAVEPWSKGDFSTFIHDISKDEIGYLAQQLNRMAEQLQNLLQTRQRFAILEERSRLARDLHDSVKQHVFVAILQLGAAKLQLEQREVGVQQHLLEVEVILQQVQQELTMLIHDLRPIVLEEQGLNSALQTLITQWSRQTGTPTSMTIEGENLQILPLLVEETLFRITQEALSNVIRHSRATNVQIHLVYARDKVELSLFDNGQGFDITHVRGGSIGLTSMQERITAIGGKMHIESTSEMGTSVVVHYAKQHIVV